MNQTQIVSKTLITVIIPPVGVFLKVKFSKHFWINLILTFLGYFPGLLHGIYVLTKK